MNVFQQFFQCFYALKKTAVYRFQSIGKTILYVFVLMLFTTIPVAISLYIDADQLIGQAGAFTAKAPEFEINNGLLYSESQKPLTWEEDNYTYIFDSTGETTSSAVLQHEHVVAFLEDEVIIARNGQPQSIGYAFFPDGFDNQALIQLLDNLQQWLFIITPIFFIVMVLFSAGLKFIDISLLSVAGLLLKNVMKRRLNYSQLWRLSAYAITIPTVLFALLDAFHVNIPAGFFLYWVLAFLCMFTILTGVPKPKNV